MHTVIHEYARCNQNYFYLVKKYCRRNIGTHVGYRIYLADLLIIGRIFSKYISYIDLQSFQQFSIKKNIHKTSELEKFQHTILLY